MQKDSYLNKVGVNLSKWQKIVLVIINILVLPFALFMGALGALGEGGELGFLLGFLGILSIPNIVLAAIYYVINLGKVLPNKEVHSNTKRIYMYTLLVVLIFNGMLLFMEVKSYMDGLEAFIAHLILNLLIFFLSFIVSFIIRKMQK